MIDEIDFAEIDVLLDDLAAKHRRGERLELPPNIAANPDLAKRVQKLLNTMLAMEGLATPFPGVRKKSRRHHAHVDQVGGYQIIREIGRGGMGVVYEAEQPALRRRVALKVLPDFAMDDPVAIERFQREARAAARLHHTNIVPVFEVGRDGQRQFFAMQLIAGCGLDQLIHLRRSRSSRVGAESLQTTASVSAKDNEDIVVKPKRLAQRTRLFAEPDSPSPVEIPSLPVENGTTRISVAPDWIGSKGTAYFRAIALAGSRAASALNHAHSRGVIHRDIKPSNLLVDESGVLWVTDFGLAKTEDENLTRSNAILGTVRYMAPERFRGQGDSRSDIYSLGVTLYEMAAMRPAFTQHDQAELISAITKSEPPRLRTIDPTIPRDFETVILKAIEKDPERRYQTAADLQADLERFANDEPVVARRASLTSKFIRWCRKSPVVAGLTATVAALLICFAVYFHSVAKRTQHELDLRVGLQIKETMAKNDANERLFEARLEQAKAIRRGVEIGRRFKSLQAIREAARIRPDSRVRDEAIATFAHFDVEKDREPIELSDEPGSTTHSSGFDSRLERYAVVSNRGIVVRNAADRRVLRRLAHPIQDGFWSGGSAFSPSDRYLVVHYGLYNSLAPVAAIWDLTAGPDAQPTVRRDTSVYWLPRERLLLVNQATGRLSIVDPTTWRTTWTAPWKIARNQSVRVANDEKTAFVWSYYSNDVEQRRLSDGKELTRFKHDAELTSIGLSPDGRLLVTAARNFECIVWNLETHTRQTTLIGHLGGPQVVNFHPTGAIVATTTWGEATKFWNPRDGRLLLSFADSVDRFSADGAKFVTRIDTQSTIWRFANSDVEMPLNLEPMTVNFGGPTAERIRIDFSPDDQLIACTQPMGIRIFECRNFTEVAAIPCGRVEAVFFDAAGRNLFGFGRKYSFRWPIRKDIASNAVCYRLGPPIRLQQPTEGMLDRATISDNRKWAVVPFQSFNDVAVFELGRPLAPKIFGPLDRIRNVALSPDGRFVAGGGWRSNRIAVWETATGRKAAELDSNPGRNSEPAAVVFSPDGQRLVTQSHDLRFWDVDTWKLLDNGRPLPVRQLDIAPAFSPRGDLLAVAMSEEEIRLFDAKSMTKLASLSPSMPVNLNTLTFSPGGGLLAATTVDHKVRVWNLTKTRHRLRDMKLDWSSESPESAGNDLTAVGRDGRPIIEAFGCTQAWPEFNAWWTIFATYSNGWLRAATADEHFQRYQAWRDLERPALARASLDAAVASDPNHFEARLALIRRCQADRQADAWLANCNTALRINPDHRDALFSRGKCLEVLQRWPEAARDYERLCQLNPGDSRARVARASAWIYSGRVKDAAAELRNLHRAFWFDYQFGSTLLRALVRDGEPKILEEKINYVISRCGSSIENEVARALVFGPPATRRPDLALKHINNALARNPKADYFWNTLGLVLNRLNRPQESIEAVNKSIALAPKGQSEFDAILLALAHIRQGKPDQARTELALTRKLRDANLWYRHPTDVAELNLLIAEAEAGIPNKPTK